MSKRTFERNNAKWRVFYFSLLLKLRPLLWPSYECEHCLGTLGWWGKSWCRCKSNGAQAPGTPPSRWREFGRELFTKWTGFRGPY